MFSVLLSNLGLSKEPTVHGFMYAHATDLSATDPNMSLARLRLTITDEGLGELVDNPDVSRTGIHLDTDVRKASNELNQLYYFAETLKTTYKVGRVFSAAGWSVPAGHYYKTAAYPVAVLNYGFFGYGGQFEHRDGKLFAMADMTGSTSEKYGSSQTFSRLESSFRTGIGDDAREIAVSGQLSDQFTRFGIDAASRIGRFDLNGALFFGDDEKNKDPFSSYLVCSYDLHKWLQPHAQVEYRHDGNVVGTTGFVFGSFRKLSAVLDYETGGQNDGVNWRVQFRHDF